MTRHKCRIQSSDLIPVSSGAARVYIRQWTPLQKFHDSFSSKVDRGFTPDLCENTILRYELAMMAKTCTNNLRVVLSP